jgi:uncharacterized protein YjbJ (UPF0337 family)
MSINTKIMNNTESKGNWNGEKLKKNFAILTDKNLLLIESKEDGLMSKLQVKLGRAKEKFYNLLELV